MAADYEDILFIGPHYKNHRGGIGAVLEQYSSNIRPFHFLPSYNYGSKFNIITHYFAFLFRFTGYLIVKRKIKIVHIHSSSRGSFFRKSIIVLLAKVFGKKTIIHIHGSEFNLFYEKSGIFQSYIRKILRLNDRVICLSPQWFTFFAGIVSVDKLRILNNPVAIVTLTAKNRNNRYLQFLFLGRIGHRKGIFDILAALKYILPEKRDKIRLMVGGDGEIQKLNETIKQLSIGNCVEYAGWVDGDRKIELLESSDIYILPSYHEGLPVSILEAMSFGLPIISSPVGGIPEVVKEGVNGFLVEPGNMEQLARAIEKMIDMPLLVSEQGKQSLQMVKPYLANAVFPALDIVYQELLGQPGKNF